MVAPFAPYNSRYLLPPPDKTTLPLVFPEAIRVKSGFRTFQAVAPLIVSEPVAGRLRHSAKPSLPMVTVVCPAGTCATPDSGR